MLFRTLGDAVMIVHLAFILFVALGGLLAWRWPRLMWLHLATVVYGAGIVVIGWDCPLTPLEKAFRERGGQAVYDGGFVDRYIEGVVYPEEYAAHLRGVAVVLIVVAYARIVARRRSALNV